MNIQIDSGSPTPIYQQIKLAIIQAIAMGEVKNGESLPSVRQLADDINVNMHTVNKAYNLLKQDGYISLSRRNGAIICEKLEAGREDIDRILALIFQAATEAQAKGIAKEQFLNVCEQAFSSYTKS